LELNLLPFIAYAGLKTNDADAPLILEPHPTTNPSKQVRLCMYIGAYYIRL